MKIMIRDVALLNELILKKGFTQRSFGREIEISPAYSNQVLSGKRNPGPKIAKKIADTLEVEFDEIFFIESAYKSDQEKQSA